MSVEERDLRMMVVAFEDAVTWCHTVADLAERLLESAAADRRISEPDVERARTQLADTRRYLEANVGEVQRIKARAGLS